MRYFCPKCNFVCNKKMPNAIFLEVKCLNCGHHWLDRQETTKPTNVEEVDLHNFGVDND